MHTTILVAAIVEALIIGYLILVARSNYKRINQLERDVTYIMTGRETVSVDFSHDGDGKQHRNDSDARAAAPQIADAATVLREAHVQDQKAYAAAALALKHGWGLLDVQENIKMVRFMKAASGDVQKVNIYYGGKGGKRNLYTVATALNHPTRGKTQLFRKHITEQELEQILRNPRQHTDKGYYQNGGKR